MLPFKKKENLIFLIALPPGIIYIKKVFTKKKTKKKQKYFYIKHLYICDVVRLNAVWKMYMFFFNKKRIALWLHCPTLKKKK